MPRLTPFGLPDQMAVRATNCKLNSGEVRGINALATLHDFGNNAIKKAFRIPGSPDIWMGFEDPDAVVVRSPVTNDTFKRYYWHEPGGRVYYNTEARIANGDPAFKLGIPQPDQDPTVTPSGGTGPTVTRAYVYTFVSAYGEEGPPSNPITNSGNNDGTWAIANLDTTPSEAADRNITHKNIYRTVTSITGTADYYLVAQVTLATTSYNDTEIDSIVAGRGQNLLSAQWFEPETDMDGMVGFPNGVLLGWRDSDIFMTVPFRPHAWNPLYTVSVKQPIVGIGVTGNTAVVCTQGPPSAITMNVPEAAALQEIQAPEPCLSRGSIIGTPAGVFYASQNGLMFFGPNGFDNITREILSEDEWERDYNPGELRATRHQTQYIGITQPGTGYVLDSAELRQGFVELANLGSVSNLFDDIWTGEVYLMSNGVVYLWDEPQSAQLVWRWASKRWLLPYEANVGAVRLTGHKSAFEGLPATPGGSQVAFVTVPPSGGGPTMSPPVDPPTWAGYTLRVYADNKLCYTRHVNKYNETLKLPTGFKSTDWLFEVVGRIPLVKLEWAETAKELAQV